MPTGMSLSGLRKREKPRVICGKLCAYFRLSFAYTGGHVPLACRPNLRFCGSLQGLRRDGACPGSNSPRLVGRGDLPALRGKAALFTERNLSRKTLAPADVGEAQTEGAVMGLMRRAITREEQERSVTENRQRQANERFASTVAIAASIIAAIRLARDPEIGRPSPRVASVIADSIALAKMILEKVLR